MAKSQQLATIRSLGKRLEEARSDVLGLEEALRGAIARAVQDGFIAKVTAAQIKVQYGLPVPAEPPEEARDPRELLSEGPVPEEIDHSPGDALMDPSLSPDAEVPSADETASGAREVAAREGVL